MMVAPSGVVTRWFAINRKDVEEHERCHGVECVGEERNIAGVLVSPVPAPGTVTDPDDMPPAVEFGLISEPDVELRARPNLTAEVVTTLAMGDEVRILQTPEYPSRYAWYQVRTEDGAVGWVLALELELETDADHSGSETSRPVGPPPSDLTLVTGATATVTFEASVRTEPGFQEELVETLPIGTLVTIVDGPMTADGQEWFAVATDGEPLGWTLGVYLAPGQRSAVLQIGDRTTISRDNAALLPEPGPLRPSVQPITHLTRNQPVTILEGPVDQGGTEWYEVRTDGGTSGWVTRADLELSALPANATPSSVASNAELRIGQAAFATEQLVNVRIEPSLSADIVVHITPDQSVTILDGPVIADNTEWYQVETADGETGWVMGVYLDPASN